MPKLKEALRLFLFFAKALPALSLFVLVLLAVEDWLVPWPPARQPLDTFGTQLRICAGRASSTAIMGFGDSPVTNEQRSYILIPRVFVSPSILTISVDPSGGAASVHASAGNLAFFGAVVLLFGWLTWRWWVRPIRTGGRGALRLAI